MARHSIERLWQKDGLDCAVVLNHLHTQSHRTGYVRVPETHPWHGVGYNEPAPTPPPSDEVLGNHVIDDDCGIVPAFIYGISDDEKRSELARRPDYRIAVHGGLTFSGDLGLDGLPDGHWFGFDCAHLADDLLTWTEEAVAVEVERLAEQLAQIDPALRGAV